jgi:hypothetical protein
LLHSSSAIIQRLLEIIAGRGRLGATTYYWALLYIITIIVMTDGLGVGNGMEMAGKWLFIHTVKIKF